MPDRLVPMTVDAEVRGGVVTLTGTANWQYSGDEAEFLAVSVPGVLGIRNDIALASKADGRDVRACISDAYRRSARTVVLPAPAGPVITAPRRAISAAVSAGSSLPRPVSGSGLKHLPCPQCGPDQDGSDGDDINMPAPRE